MAPRETGSDMLKFNCSGYREEYDDQFQVGLKVLPIRMYIDQDTLIFLANFFKVESDPAETHMKVSVTDTIFFRSCQVDKISIKVDYKAKKIDFSSIKDGKLIELLNFVNLDGASLILEPVKLTAIHGLKKLIRKIIGIWIPHIRNTQVPNLASGISGLKTLVNIGAGFKELVYQPVNQYQKDGNIIKGF
jgi:autophagy-related protein 2